LEIVNKDVFKEIAENLKVLGRSNLEDKLILVTGLRNLGANTFIDGPALKEADIGFAMGISGNEVAKEAADIILLDDNFTSIVNAVRWGQSIFSCIRKFLQFQLSINIGAIMILIICSITLEPDTQPLRTLKLLWINIPVSLFACLAFATEKPSLEGARTPF